MLPVLRFEVRMLYMPNLGNSTSLREHQVRGAPGRESVARGRGVSPTFDTANVFSGWHAGSEWIQAEGAHITFLVRSKHYYSCRVHCYNTYI